MQKNGIRMSFGSDYPVEPLDPLISLYACVTRRMHPDAPPGGPTDAWIPEERISLDDCIRTFTQGSAYAEFSEKLKGKISPGQFADIVVLSNDITQIPAPQMLKTKVLMTFTGGKLVYERK